MNRDEIEKRFRKEVADQVKATLLMAALEQVDEDHKLNPISQPQLNVDAIQLPEEGPMTFEMDVEVRPEFPLPDYKALTVEGADPDNVLTLGVEKRAGEYWATWGGRTAAA